MHKFLKEKKAVLFDLDGTLLDTLADLGNSVNRVLSGRGLPNHALDAYRYFVGDGATTLIKRALPSHLTDDPETVGMILKDFLSDYSRNWAVSTNPYPGITEMLSELARREIKLAVLSNKPDNFTKLCIERFFPEHDFAIVAGEVAGTARKPDPAGALAIAEQLNLLPENFLYLGDTAIDMETAGAAGMFAVGAAWGFRPREELLQHGARAIIDQPMQLVNLLPV